jgi:hypothetical protein
MKRTIIILIILTQFSCSKNKSFESFVFSYGSLHSNYSLKFTNSDTIYLEQRFPLPRTTYIGFINEKDKKIVTDFLANTNFSKFEKEYFEENISDPIQLSFSLTKKTTEKNICIIGNDGPKIFYDFAKQINFTKQKQKFKLTEKNIDFGDISCMIPPPPPPPRNNNR